MIRIATTENTSRLHHYAAVVDRPDIAFTDDLQPPFTADKVKQFDAFIVSCEYLQQSRLALLAAKANRIPTFHVIDGILEWRNLFDNPRTSERENGAPLYQPLMADFTFCMGNRQQATLNWLGNEAVYATGLPRLDPMIPVPAKRGESTTAGDLLVATANTPWFTAEQKDAFCSEFAELAGQLPHRLASLPGSPGCMWRVAEAVSTELSLPAAKEKTAAEALANCRAVIATPSTFAVEAMLAGVPTMIFDPYSCPELTPVAWYTTSVSGVMHLLPSLLDPCPNRMRLQEKLLREITPADGQAANRVHDFIVNTVQQGQPVADDSAAEARRTDDQARTEFSGRDIPPLADLVAAYETIPSLDRDKAGMAERIRELEDQIARPSLRKGLGAFFRGLTKLPPRQR